MDTFFYHVLPVVTCVLLGILVWIIVQWKRSTKRGTMPFCSACSDQQVCMSASQKRCLAKMKWWDKIQQWRRKIKSWMTKWGFLIVVIIFWLAWTVCLWMEGKTEEIWNYNAPTALFTGCAFWGAWMAYQAAQTQISIAREQNMDAACFEYLNYLESRKLAIDESGCNKQPFDWLQKAYNTKYNGEEQDDYRKLLQNSGTWYRTVMLWLDRVVTAYPNEQKQRTRYANMLLFNLSLDEQRCLQLYAYCADDISENLTDKKLLDQIKGSLPGLAAHSFLERHPRTDQIKALLTDFFQNKPSLQAHHNTISDKRSDTLHIQANITVEYTPKKKPGENTGLQ